MGRLRSYHKCGRTFFAAVAYARAKDLGEDAIRSASRIVILATVRIGEELIAGQDRGEVAKRPDGTAIRDHVDGDDMVPATLSDLGISRDLSSTAQRLARHPEAVADYLGHAAEPSLAGALNALIREATVEVTTHPKTGEEVRIGMGQTQRAAKLGVGRNTVKRWDAEPLDGPYGPPALLPTHFREPARGRVLPLHPNRKPAAGKPTGTAPTPWLSPSVSAWGSPKKLRNPYISRGW